MTERRERGWLPEGGNPPRRGVLEDTLFRRLEEMRKKPPGELFELLERTLDVLRATKEALLEQRREIRSLATAVDTLRTRVDQLVQPRHEFFAAEATAPPPESEPEPEAEPEPEPELLPAAEGAATEPSAADSLDQVAEPTFEPESESSSQPAEPWFEPEPEPAVEAAPVEAAPVEAAPEPVVDEPAYHRAPEQAVEHVLMLSTAAGYRILVGDGAEPAARIDVDGIVFEISGRMSSPFPGDLRATYFATAS